MIDSPLSLPNNNSEKSYCESLNVRNAEKFEKVTADVY